MTTGTLKTIDALEAAGLLRGQDRAPLDEVAERYAVAITPTLAELIDPNDPAGPIARQFLPHAHELETAPEEMADPIGDHAHEPVKGIVHRYPDRVLLKLVHACPVYCRFCFRREMVGPGGEAPLAGETLEAALNYITSHSEIWEVILTGGDPFIVPTRIARSITRRLEAVEHVKIIRWHTRVPIAEPARITDDFVDAIRSHEKTIYVVLHVNHARELSYDAREAIARLRSAGIPLLSQSVLLRGVNDNAGTLGELFRALTVLGIKPYYLHQMDLAPGTAHFRVPLEEAQEIYSNLKRQISGLALPNFVIDIPGGFGKVSASRGHIFNVQGELSILDDRGQLHDYPPSRER
ncbi:MAG: lysine-2,3-aminomutase-like protein [Alphaproteobacteria bacterium]